jgi:hypothetical protein
LAALARRTEDIASAQRHLEAGLAFSGRAEARRFETERLLEAIDALELALDSAGPNEVAQRIDFQ